MPEQIAGLAVLQGPYEIFDYPDQGILTTRVLKWDHGQVFIQTGQVPEGKWVEACRIHVPPEVTRPRLPYVDITSKTLCAQLKPMLEGIVAQGRTVKIQKHGVAPAARFTVEVV